MDGTTTLHPTTAAAGQQLRVALTEPDPGADFFLRDLRTMLSSIARAVDAAELEWRQDGGAWTSRIVGPAPLALLHEVGRHRAQWVRILDSGRVHTTIAVVELEPHRSSTVVRTFNYPGRRCTAHRSGIVVSFEHLWGGAG